MQSGRILATCQFETLNKYYQSNCLLPITVAAVSNLAHLAVQPVVLAGCLGTSVRFYTSSTRALDLVGWGKRIKMAMSVDIYATQ